MLINVWNSIMAKSYWTVAILFIIAAIGLYLRTRERQQSKPTAISTKIPL